MTYQELLIEMAEQDPRFMVLTAENRAHIRRIPERFGKRFLDTGITEQTMVGMSAGLALRGKIPIVHALATFLTLRAFEFIRTDIGISGLPVKLMGFVPGVLSEANGPTHQALEDVSLMRSIPGMQVFCPSDEEDLIKGLPSVLSSPHPAYIRYNARPAQTSHRSPFILGKAEVFGKGTDIAVCTYGNLFSESLTAIENLGKKGYSTRLINFRCLEPFDNECALETLKNCQFIVTIEDHFLRGGLYTLMAELCVANQVMKPILPIGFDQKWFKPALLKDVLEHEKLTGAHLANRILNSLERKNTHGQ